MKVLIVRESYFGNGTKVVDSVATAIAQQLGDDAVEVVEAGEAPTSLPEDVVALIVSAPTHELSLPTPKTRRAAREQGAIIGFEYGLREWIDAVEVRENLMVMAIDTCTKISSVIGSASKAAVKGLKKRGFTDVHRGPSFLVGGTEGPLQSDEINKAQAWGKELGAGVLTAVA